AAELGRSHGRVDRILLAPFAQYAIQIAGKKRRQIWRRSPKISASKTSGMNILGLNCYGNDAAASLVCDGIVRFAAEEERLNRTKHSGAFPERAIREALRFCSLDFSDIEHVGFSWDPKISYLKIPIYLIRYWRTLPQLLRERKGFSMEENLGML